MTLLNPLGLLLGSILIIIVIFYFRKKQATEFQISNLDFWDQIIAEVEGVKTARLNKYLLMLLQLLLAFLIVLAFSEPVIINNTNEDVITIGLDCSITMNAKDDRTSHFHDAKHELIKYIENLSDDTLINLIALSKSSNPLLELASKKETLDIIKEINATNQPLDLNKAEQVINIYAGKKVVVTDKELPFDYETIKVGASFNNVGIIDINYDYYNKNLLCRVKNYTNSDKELHIKLLGDKGHENVKKVAIPANKEVDVNFQVPTESDQLIIKLDEKDALIEDNTLFINLGESSKQKVLLIGNNPFLNIALASIPNIKLEAVDKWSDDLVDYDLYIVNEDIDINVLPKEANIWTLKPNKNLIVETESEMTKPQIINMNVIDEKISKNLNMSQIILKDNSYLTNSGDYTTLIKIKDKPIMSYKLENEKMRLYSTFDFNNTNLVVKPDFPILIKNILDFVVGKNKLSYYPGDKIYPSSDISKELYIDGNYITDINNYPYTINSLGRYEIKAGNKQLKEFTVNPPKTFIVGTDSTDVTFENTDKLVVLTTDIKKIIILLVVVLLILEWEVYRREY